MKKSQLWFLTPIWWLRTVFLLKSTTRPLCMHVVTDIYAGKALTH